MIVGFFCVAATAAATGLCFYFAKDLIYKKQ
jgi:hypothetical protein